MVVEGANKDRGAAARNADRSPTKAGTDQRRESPAPVSESPGAEHEARLPVRHKLHCEAPAGVADPITTVPSEVDCLYPGGWIVLVSRKVQHAVKLG